MGTKTYATFQSDLLFELGNRTDLTSKAGGFINEAYLDLTTRDMIYGLRVPLKICFPQLDADTTLSTTDGVPYVALPSKCLFPEAVHNSTSDKKLSYRPWKWYLEQTGRASTSSEAKPEYWSWRNANIYLFRTPDATYSLTLYYRKVVTAMDGISTNTTDIGEEWDEVITKLAVVKTLFKLKRYEEAKIEKEEFIEMLFSKISVYNNSRLDTNVHLTPHTSYYDRS